MKSSIYISADKIQAIGYIKSKPGITVKDYLTMPLPEGTMLDGRILDVATLSICLTKMRSQKPALFAAPDLVIDGGFILLRKLEVPLLRKDQYVKFLTEEFASVTVNFHGLACGYTTLSSVPGGASTILACAADSGLVEAYVTTFKSIGIKVATVRIAAQTLIKHVSSRPELQDSTFVLNVLDGMNMISMIFDKGENVFTTRTRLYSEEREQLRNDILENLSGLVQFTQSEKFNDLQYSYYVGLEEEDIAAMSAMSHFPDIELQEFYMYAGSRGTEVLEPDTHFAFLNSLHGEDCIDLVDCVRVTDKVKKPPASKAWIALLVMLVAALGGIFAYMSYLQSGIDYDIKKINTFMDDNESKLNEVKRNQAQAANARGLKAALEAKVTKDAETPELSREVIELLTGTMQGSVVVGTVSFNGATSVITLSGRGSSVNNVAAYVETLRNSELTGAVKYPGYGGGTDGWYTFNLEITLAKKEVAENE